RAQETLPKDLRRRLQRSAAALAAQAGRTDDALLLYRESHDWDEMARLIEAEGPTMLEQGRGESLRHWIEDLPPELLERYPWAVYWSAASQAQIAPREARLAHEKAFELFRARGEAGSDGAILAAAGAMDAILCALTLMWTGLFSRAEQLIEHARRAAAAPGVSPFARITLKNVETMYCMLVAQYTPGLQAMREGLEIARSTGVHTWTFQLLVHGY